jgi:hypothetical protein
MVTHMALQDHIGLQIFTSFSYIDSLHSWYVHNTKERFSNSTVVEPQGPTLVCSIYRWYEYRSHKAEAAKGMQSVPFATDETFVTKCTVCLSIPKEFLFFVQSLVMDDVPKP